MFKLYITDTLHDSTQARSLGRPKPAFLSRPMLRLNFSACYSNFNCCVGCVKAIVRNNIIVYFFFLQYSTHVYVFMEER